MRLIYLGSENKSRIWALEFDPREDIFTGRGWVWKPSGWKDKNGHKLLNKCCKCVDLVEILEIGIFLDKLNGRCS